MLIRKIENKNKHPLIVACSAHIDEATRKKNFEMGFDMVFEAPLNSLKMKEIIDRLKD